MPETSPSDAAAKAAAVVENDLRTARAQELHDSLDIRDPATPRNPVYETPPGTTEPPTTRPAPQTIPGAVAAATLSADLLGRAQALGISPEHARATPEPVLRELIAARERLFAPPQPVAQPQQRQQQPTIDDIYAALDQGYAWDPQAGWVEIDQQTGPDLDRLRHEMASWRDEEGRQLAEPLVNIFDGMRATVEQQNRQLAQMQQQLQHAQQAQQQLIEQQTQQQHHKNFLEMERLFVQDTAMHDLFGNVPAHLAQPQHIQARHQMNVMMGAIHDNYVQAGQPAPDIPTLYEMAKGALYRDRAAQQTERQVADRARDAAGRFIGRTSATTRSSDWESLPRGEERATRALAALMRHSEN